MTTSCTMPLRPIVPSITCAHCWTQFPPFQMRFIAEHASLRGDPIVGEDAGMRFLPSRFDVHGRVIDPHGAIAPRMACPRCHLELPAAMLELPSVTLSVVGAPASGKSVMLAAASFSLRSGLVVDGLEFIDADPTLNDLTYELESALFRSTTPDSPAMIAKTDLSGRLYRSFRVGEETWTAPKPQLFAVGRRGHRALLCLYDNAGEHFLPWRGSSQAHATGHLAVSDAMVFVIDPTQDRRVIERLGGHEAVQARGGAGSVDQCQDFVLTDVAQRVRALRGLSGHERLPFRLVVALSKADIWGGLTDPSILADVDGAEAGRSIAVPSIERLQRAHAACSDFLSRFMPEVLLAARKFDPDMRIVPFSALGSAPMAATREARLAIRPRDVKPIWPAAPLVVALAEAEQDLLPEYALG